MRLPLLFGICLLLGASSVHAQSTAPVQATLDQLMKSPKQYASKVVRVRGQIDNCVALTCNLCPEEMTRETFDREKCLGLEFEAFDHTGVSEVTEWAFRFATVTLDANFDPTCLSTGQGVCLDRATVLFDARVQKVHSRKSALDGIISWYDQGALSAPPEPERIAMRTAITDLLVDKSAEVEVFAVSKKALGLGIGDAEGLGCVCKQTACKWPTRWFGGFQSLGAPFDCYFMIKKAEIWRVLPALF